MKKKICIILCGVLIFCVAKAKLGVKKSEVQQYAYTAAIAKTEDMADVRNAIKGFENIMNDKSKKESERKHAEFCRDICYVTLSYISSGNANGFQAKDAQELADWAFCAEDFAIYAKSGREIKDLDSKLEFVRQIYERRVQEMKEKN